MTSEWHRDVYKILILTSHDFGGSNSISSITRGSPDFLLIAAVPFHMSYSHSISNIKHKLKFKDEPLHLIGLPIYSLVTLLMIGIGSNKMSSDVGNDYATPFPCFCRVRVWFANDLLKSNGA